MTNPALRLISQHGPNVTFPASPIGNLRNPLFFAMLRRSQSSEEIKAPFIKGGLRKLWSLLLCAKILYILM